MFSKKFNANVAHRSRLARIGRQTRDQDEREELEDVVCGAIRTLGPLVPRYDTVVVVETRPGRKATVREVRLAG